MRGDVPPDVLAAVGVLGPICIYGRDGRLSVRGGKQQRLLAVLSAAHGRTVSTDQLIDTLWGAAPPSSAPTALRVHVARLRDILTAASAPAPRLVHRPPGYALEIAAERIDAMQFTSLVSAPVDVDPEVSLVRLERALALWRGDPYGGLSDSDLLRMEARRLSELYEEALEDRAEALLLLGEHHQAAVSELEALVRSDPLRERRSKLLMTALYRGGRQADALEVYHRLRRLLDRELGLAPSPGLQALQQAILSQDDALEAPVRRASAALTDAGERLPWWLEMALDAQMYGRGDLVDELCDKISTGLFETERPGLQVLLLRGEGGVGKSRVLAELARRALGRGVGVLAGWCDRDAVLPFRPLTEAFRQLVGRRTATNRASSVAADHITRFLTETQPTSPEIDPGTDRLRYFEAVVQLLREAAEKQPHVLVIDDIQWLDPSSAALLRHLIRQPGSHPIVVVACCRTDPAEWSGAWTTVLAEFRRLPTCSIVDITDLTPDAALEVLADVRPDLDRQGLRDLADRILPVTGGNPLFIREIATRLSATPAEPTDPIPVPASMLAAVRERLTNLSRSARNVVNTASVLGQHFRLRDLAVVVGCDETAALAALEEAQAAYLVEEAPNDIDSFFFRHALIREAVKGLMPRSRRVRIHLAAGLAVEGSDIESLSARAYHLLEAVPLCSADSAARASVAAADAALGRLAFEEAARVIRRAIDVTTSAAVEEATAFDLWMRLGRACSYLGESEAGERAFATAAERARVMGDPRRLAIAALGDDLDTRVLTPSRARLALLEESLATLGEHDDSLRVAVGSAYVALAAISTGGARLHALADETVALARRLGDPAALSKALLASLTCTNATVAGRDRLAVATEALELAETAGNPHRVARARLSRMGLLLQVGRAAEAREDHARFSVLAAAMRAPRLLWHAEVSAAALYRLVGRFDEAEAAAERALSVGQNSEIPEATMVFAVHRFFTAMHCGRLGELRSTIDRFASSRPDLLSWTLSAGLAARAADDHPAARRALHRFEAAMPSLDPDGEFWSAQLMQAAQLAYDLDAAPDVAERLWDGLVPHRGEFAVFGATTATLGPVDRALGGLAARRGDPNGACRLYSAAFQLCETMGATTWLLWSGADLAAQLVLTNRPEEALAVAEQIRPVAEAVGASWHCRRLPTRSAS